MPKSPLTVHRFDTTLKRWVCQCRACGEVWISQSEKAPAVCRNCRSSVWDEAYKKKGRKGR